jgi:hypothetical protein
MIEITKEKMQRAIERCRELKPKVRFVAERVFNVFSSNNANVYTVRFDVRNGQKLAQCTCKASERGMMCYHIAGAAAANIYRQSLKRGN